ncbi:hypothetical protein BS78_04G309700 [Paspalum vaginatum]|nr:hypothetical protein BS78_04G309700 [Paspalum vaginatum]
MRKKRSMSVQKAVEVEVEVPRWRWRMMSLGEGVKVVDDESSEGGGGRCGIAEVEVADDESSKGGRGGDCDRRLLMVMHAQQASWADLIRSIPEEKRMVLESQCHNVEILQVHFHNSTRT